MVIDHAIFHRYDYITLTFWNLNLTKISKTGAFRYSTMNGMMQYALENASSLALLLFAPEHVYRESKRPVNSMEMFQTPDSHIIREIPDPLEFIPVTRYAKGMRRGLYHDGEHKDYCGTFYYHEPESTTYLRASRVLRAKNKRAVAILLTIDLKDEELDPDRFQFIKDFEDSSLMFTPRELEKLAKEHSYVRYLANAYINWDYINHAQQDRPYYCAHILELYAAEDYLDQIICTKGREAGYDVIVLEKMVGSRQIVTEVLDTRPRDESFGNLYFLKR
jgi:hypothetical protein